MGRVVIDNVRLPTTIVKDQQTPEHWLDVMVGAYSRCPTSFVRNSREIHQSGHQTLPSCMTGRIRVTVHVIFICMQANRSVAPVSDGLRERNRPPAPDCVIRA
eukprot:COSAG02_NODE_3715_length_6332_cov_3.252206_2_plen_103_part_00